VNSRRTFLGELLGAGLAAGLAERIAALGQTPDATQEKPLPPENAPEAPLPPIDKRILEENQKDIKKKVEKLYELASQLKEEVEKTDSSKVLSLNLVRKAEEIEKLARDIKNRTKG
jgi:DNA-binding ferritin-like protein